MRLIVRKKESPESDRLLIKRLTGIVNSEGHLERAGSISVNLDLRDAVDRHSGELIADGTNSRQDLTLVLVRILHAGTEDWKDRSKENVLLSF